MLPLPLLLPLFACAYCGTYLSGEPEYTIHRDGFGVGPEVPLCFDCYDDGGPSCLEIWERIAQPENRSTGNTLN